MKYMLIGLSFLTLTFNASALTSQDVYTNSVNAVLYLEFYEDGGTNCPIGGANSCHATGFFVEEDGIVFTNHHVEGDAVTMTGRSNLGNNYTNFTVLYSDEYSDIAVLKVSKRKENDTFLNLGSNKSETKVGDKVFWIGHPATLKFSFSEGYISNLNVEKEGKLIDLQYNGVGFGGSSGSPVLNTDGQVIGIHRRKDEDVEGVRFGSGLNHIEKALKIAKARLNTLNTEVKENDFPIENKSPYSEETNSKNDLASLIRELKAYTPPSEVRLGSK